MAACRCGCACLWPTPGHDRAAEEPIAGGIFPRPHTIHKHVSPIRWKLDEDKDLIRTHLPALWGRVGAPFDF